MRFWPAPFGKSSKDDPDSASDSADPRYLSPKPNTPVALPVLTSNPYDKGELARMAAGEPERTHQEIIDSVHGRPVQARTPVPVPHQRVQFRRSEWGPLEPATVIQVQDISQIFGTFGLVSRGPRDAADPNMLINNAQDPMPLVLLMTDGGMYTWTREARVRGACGWLR